MRVRATPPRDTAEAAFRRTGLIAVGLVIVLAGAPTAIGLVALDMLGVL